MNKETWIFRLNFCILFTHIALKVSMALILGGFPLYLVLYKQNSLWMKELQVTLHMQVPQATLIPWIYAAIVCHVSIYFSAY